MSKTDENLKAAFAGESQANQKYLGFAEKAGKEKFPMVAKLFRAAARAEHVHAQRHARVMHIIGATLDNLKAAASGEAYEFTEMYPVFLREAEQEGNQAACRAFDDANDVEKIHHALYSRAIESVQQGKDLPQSKIFVCGNCGNTVLGEPPEKCPVCGVPKSQFKEIA